MCFSAPHNAAYRNSKYTTLVNPPSKNPSPSGRGWPEGPGEGRASRRERGAQRRVRACVSPKTALRLTVPRSLARCAEPSSHRAAVSGALRGRTVSLRRSGWRIARTRRLAVPRSLAHCAEPPSHGAEGSGALRRSSRRIAPPRRLSGATQSALRIGQATQKGACGADRTASRESRVAG